MLSLLLVTAMSAVADTPPTTAKVATRAYYTPAPEFSYYQPMNYAYSPPRGFDGAGCYCPTDDVDLFLPCFPVAPCSVAAPCPVAGPRVRVHTPPYPIRVCPAPCRPPCP